MIGLGLDYDSWDQVMVFVFKSFQEASSFHFFLHCAITKLSREDFKVFFVHLGKKSHPFKLVVGTN
jgi:hypothetical protein